MKFWTSKFLGVFMFGLILGVILKICVSISLAKRDCESPGWIWGLVPANGLLCLWVMNAAGWQAQGLLFCLCTSALLAVAVIDGKTMEIPLKYNLFIGGLGVLRMFFCLNRWYEYFIGFFAVSSLLLVFFLLTGGEGIGGGDVKLMAAVGLFLGWEKVLWAFWIGGLVGIMYYILFRGKQLRGKAFALGPFLVAAIIVML